VFTNRKQNRGEERKAMGVLKRKEEKSGTIAVRVPASLKAQMEELRRRADAAGFDLSTTITEALTRLAKQVREELDAAQGSAVPAANRAATPGRRNGLAGGGGDFSQAAAGGGKAE
jgi:hypothetical protein